MPITRLYPWIAVLIALVALYGAHRYIVNTEVDRAVQFAITSMEKSYQIAADEAKVETEKLEEKLRVTVLKERETKNAKIATINAKLERTQRLLASRPSRPAPDATGTVAPSGGSATGRELYREDGLFLAGEAAAAETVVQERDYYYNLYENARKQINEQRQIPEFREQATDPIPIFGN